MQSAPRLPLAGPAAPRPVERRSRRALEPSVETDLLHDYVLEPYAPLAPQAGKLRSVNVLQETFALAGVDDAGAAAVEAVRAGLGPFRTVWGVKHDRALGVIKGWELYFYDWQRVHADLSIERLARLLAPIVRLDAAPPRPLPWHMVSVEISPEQLRSGGGSVPAHVYIDMRSYELLGSRFTFENVYTFHDPRREIDDVMARLRASVHLDLSRDRLAALMPAELFRCHKMCVANKRTGDALYFARVSTSALVAFLRTHGYPAELVDWIHAERGRLDHLSWDVGLDFTAEGGHAVVGRTGFYGSF